MNTIILYTLTGTSLILFMIYVSYRMEVRKMDMEQFRKQFAEAQGMDYEKVKASGHTVFAPDTIKNITTGEIITREQYAKQVGFEVGNADNVMK